MYHCVQDSIESILYLLEVQWILFEITVRRTTVPPPKYSGAEYLQNV